MLLYLRDATGGSKSHNKDQSRDPKILITFASSNDRPQQCHRPLATPPPGLQHPRPTPGRTTSHTLARCSYPPAQPPVQPYHTRRSKQRAHSVSKSHQENKVTIVFTNTTPKPAQLSPRAPRAQVFLHAPGLRLCHYFLSPRVYSAPGRALGPQGSLGRPARELGIQSQYQGAPPWVQIAD